MTSLKALEIAVGIIGGQGELARMLTKTLPKNRPIIRQSHVTYWLHVSGLPAEFCLTVEKATRRKIKCYDLRPDVFPAPRKRKVAA